MQNFSLAHHGTLKQLAPDLYQYSIIYDPKELSLEAFFQEGLCLPQQLECAVKKRQLDFLAGRYCALQCYSALQLSELALPRIQVDRSPLWPSLVLGSITHSEGIASAVVSRRHDQCSLLGLDIERLIARVSPALVNQICCDPGECQELAQTLGCSESFALTLIFSAKESLYKAIYPHFGAYFGFHSARVTASCDEAVQLILMRDLDSCFTKGRSWRLSYRTLADDFIETLLLGSKTLKVP